MNLTNPSPRAVGAAFRLWLAFLRLLPKQKCQTFGSRGSQKERRIERIYVINLDREPGRWCKIKRELKNVFVLSGMADLMSLTERHAAVDAREFLQDPLEDGSINPIYTLADQLLVEPQPLTLPTRYELDAPIRMSRAEIAVARSHINVWRRVAAGREAYALVLEDDVWFRRGFAKQLDQAWNETRTASDQRQAFDILYVSYLEVKNGAPKTLTSPNTFRPVRGLWHLSGYILSREGAQKLLELLPCRGPIDLWINHQFGLLDVLATKQSLVSQRLDTGSTNSYSVLPALTKIGAINSEVAALFNRRPIEQPVFAFGPEGTGLSSLAMALSMLGYRCCSDLRTLPDSELSLLLKRSDQRVFNAYVNIGALEARLDELKSLYPKAKFIFTTAEIVTPQSVKEDVGDPKAIFLNLADADPWKAICEHLRCAPPSCSFPKQREIGQRSVVDETDRASRCLDETIPKRDVSPWLVEPRHSWRGIHCVSTERVGIAIEAFEKFDDCLKSVDKKRWILRGDTFTDNLALFRPENVELCSDGGVALRVREEALGIRNYSAASICSSSSYLFGKFEVVMQASNAPGVVTGFFLHRNSPRQEVDIEIAGNRPDRLLVNVFFNPGGEGANFDYGYRGAPSCIDLGFDASEEPHRFAIEWNPDEIHWLVDGRLVHRRGIWNPTPVPHLPMTLHINSWPTRSTQLAGRIESRLLPSMTVVKSVQLAANRVTSDAGIENLFSTMAVESSS